MTMNMLLRPQEQPLAGHGSDSDMSLSSPTCRSDPCSSGKVERVRLSIADRRNSNCSAPAKPTPRSRSCSPVRRLLEWSGSSSSKSTDSARATRKLSMSSSIGSLLRVGSQHNSVSRTAEDVDPTEAGSLDHSHDSHRSLLNGMIIVKKMEEIPCEAAVVEEEKGEASVKEEKPQQQPLQPPAAAQQSPAAAALPSATKPQATQRKHEAKRPSDSKQRQRGQTVVPFAPEPQRKRTAKRRQRSPQEWEELVAAHQRLMGLCSPTPTTRDPLSAGVLHRRILERKRLNARLLKLKAKVLEAPPETKVQSKLPQPRRKSLPSKQSKQQQQQQPQQRRKLRRSHTSDAHPGPCPQMLEQMKRRRRKKRPSTTTVNAVKSIAVKVPPPPSVTAADERRASSHKIAMDATPPGVKTPTTAAKKTLPSENQKAITKAPTEQPPGKLTPPEEVKREQSATEEITRKQKSQQQQQQEESIEQTVPLRKAPTTSAVKTAPVVKNVSPVEQAHQKAIPEVAIQEQTAADELRSRHATAPSAPSVKVSTAAKARPPAKAPKIPERKTVAPSRGAVAVEAPLGALIEMSKASSFHHRKSHKARAAVSVATRKRAPTMAPKRNHSSASSKNGQSAPSTVIKPKAQVVPMKKDVSTKRSGDSASSSGSSPWPTLPASQNPGSTAACVEAASSSPMKDDSMNSLPPTKEETALKIETCLIIKKLDAEMKALEEMDDDKSKTPVVVSRATRAPTRCTSTIRKRSLTPPGQRDRRTTAMRNRKEGKGKQPRRPSFPSLGGRFSTAA